MSIPEPQRESGQSMPFRPSQLVTHKVCTESRPGPAGISARTALVSMFLVISSRAFSGIMSVGVMGWNYTKTELLLHSRLRGTGAVMNPFVIE